MYEMLMIKFALLCLLSVDVSTLNLSPFAKGHLGLKSPSKRLEIQGSKFLIEETEERCLIKQFMFQQLIGGTTISEEFSDDIVQTLFAELVEGPENDMLWNKSKVWKCVEAGNPEKVIGCLGMYPTYSLIGTPEIYISFFYVDKTFQNRGVGRELWRHMWDWINNCVLPFHQAPNYRTLHLITMKDVYVKAFEFYLREGFVEKPCEYPVSEDFTPVRMAKTCLSPTERQLAKLGVSSSLTIEV
jgi:GNAT superfamily N-acetyltransferase